MKKAKFTMVLVVFYITSFAQFKTSIGVLGGLNISSFKTSYANESNNESKDYSGKAGFHVGAFALFKLDRISIQPEILYSQQGTNFYYERTNGANKDFEDWRSNFTYINIPILVKYAVAITKVGEINIQAGPQISLLQKAETNFYDFDGDGAQERGGTGDLIDVKDEYANSDFGIALGAGWELPIGFTFDLRYTFGLKQISTEKGNSGPEVRNRLFQVSIGYKLLKLGH